MPSFESTEVAYHVTATDIHGNESESSESITVQLSVNQTVQTGIGWNWFSINIQSDDIVLFHDGESAHPQIVQIVEECLKSLNL